MKFVRILTENPVRTVALAQAGLVLAAAFGLHLSADQITALVGFFSAVLFMGVHNMVTSTGQAAQGAVDAATAAATSALQQVSSRSAGPVGAITEGGLDILKAAVDVATTTQGE